MSNGSSFRYYNEPLSELSNDLRAKKTICAASSFIFVGSRLCYNPRACSFPDSGVPFANP